MRWFLSGLGGDHRLYAKLTLSAPHRHLSWTDFRNCAHMDQFVQRARALGVQAGDDIVGSSFGGMLALSLGQAIPLRRLLLLGTAMSPREISQLVLLAGHWARACDGRDLQSVAGLMSYLGPKGLVLRMFRDADPAVMRGMFQAIQHWRGARPQCPWRRLHGRFDPVIPWRSSQSYHELLPCSHLVALEAAGAVQQALQWMDHPLQINSKKRANGSE